MTGVKASSIKWKSSKPGVATVSKKGIVKGVKAGTANITGKYKSLKFTIKVKVVSTTEDTTESKPTTPTSVIPSTGLYLGTCANVDLYITKIDDYYIYLKAINKNSFKVRVDYEYLNFDETTLNNIVSFEVAANNFRIYNDNFSEGAVPKNFKTVTGNVKIYNEDWELIESADLTAYVK